MPNETLEFKGTYSLIRSNKPDTLPLEGIHKIMAESKVDDLEKFGLFDSGSPNYYTYYPEVTQADMNPNDADFIYPVFRLLSKIIISPKRLAIDFTDGDILKNSMPLLIGQSIFIDHENITGSVMGVVQSVEWQEEYKLGGITIPAGINGVLKIDAKSNPRIARAIMMDPPSIHSCSVTINFSWEKSHPNLDDDKFWDLLGTYDSSKKLIRKVVSDVNMYFELSLVPHGADPFAKKIKDGKLVMTKQASKIYQMSFSAKKIEKEPYMGINGLGELVPYQSATLNFSDKKLFNTIYSNINNNESIMDFTLFLEALGLKAEDFKDEQSFIDYLKAQAIKVGETEALQSEVERLTGEVGTLNSEVERLTGEVETLTASQADQETLEFAEQGRNILSLTQAEASKFYKLLKGDKFDETMLTAISKANIEEARAFLNSFREDYENLVPLACEDCHSTKVSRKSSLSANKGESGTPVNLRKKFEDKVNKENAENFLV